MARIQILHLPCAAEESAFALVIDQLGNAAMEQLARMRPELDGTAEKLGARRILLFGDTVEVM